MNQRQPRLGALRLLTASGAIVAAGALIAITAMTAFAAVPPNLAKALDEQKRLAAARPQDATVFNDLGNLLVLAGQLDAAATAYRHATELDPHRASALFNLGLLEQQQGRTGEARKLYERVIESEPRHAWAHYQLGTLYERKGDKSRAVREYARSFELDPQLAFRDANPQIVENGLVTESLLRAYRGISSAAEAAIYDEPSRIRELMVPPQPPGKDAAEAKENQAQPAPGQGAKHPSVLRRGDLPPGTNVGQATPPGGTGRAQGRPNMPGYVPPQDSNAYQGGVRSWTRPTPANPNPVAPPVVVNPNLDATQPGTVVTPPPAGLYYRPNVPSTGRLGTQVMPEQNG